MCLSWAWPYDAGRNQAGRGRGAANRGPSQGLLLLVLWVLPPSPTTTSTAIHSHPQLKRSLALLSSFHCTRDIGLALLYPTCFAHVVCCQASQPGRILARRKGQAALAAHSLAQALWLGINSTQAVKCDVVLDLQKASVGIPVHGGKSIVTREPEPWHIRLCRVRAGLIPSLKLLRQGRHDLRLYRRQTRCPLSILLNIIYCHILSLMSVIDVTCRVSCIVRRPPLSVLVLCPHSGVSCSKMCSTCPSPSSGQP